MKDILSNYIKISDEEYELFLTKGKLAYYKKGEHLLVTGTFVKKIFFINQGFVRGYRLIDGTDVTHHFFQENWFATDYEAFITGNTSKLFLQALNDTTVYIFDKKTLSSFCNQHVKFEKIRTIIAEKAYLLMVERLKNLQTKDLKERYSNLIQNHPDLFNLVSQRYIASYLGVTPQSLSRIKNKF